MIHLVNLLPSTHSIPSVHVEPPVGKRQRIINSIEMQPKCILYNVMKTPWEYFVPAAHSFKNKKFEIMLPQDYISSSCRKRDDTIVADVE